MVAFVNQSSECKGFSSSPVDAFSSLDGVQSVLEDLVNIVVELFSFRKSGNLLSNLLKALLIHTSVSNESVLGGVLDFLPLFIPPVFCVKGGGFSKSVGFLKVCSSRVNDGLEFSLINTLFNKLVSVLVSSRDHGGYNLVHEGLGETGVIKLVMAHLSVSNHINNHVLVESLTVLSSEFKSFSNVFHAVSVDVENRGVNALSNVRSVDTRSALVRSGGEADLIVNNDMNSTSYVVVL